MPRDFGQSTKDLLHYTDDAALAAGATVFSVERARQIVQKTAEVTASGDADAFANGFTADCLVRFNHLELRGKRAVRDFFHPRFISRRDFTCDKSLRSLSGNVFGVIWTNTWTEIETSKKMAGKGVEFWVMEDELVARWDASFTAWAID